MEGLFLFAPRRWAADGEDICKFWTLSVKCVIAGMLGRLKEMQKR
jgi:hypothetical protein